MYVLVLALESRVWGPTVDGLFCVPNNLLHFHVFTLVHFFLWLIFFNTVSQVRKLKIPCKSLTYVLNPGHSRLSFNTIALLLLNLVLKSFTCG